MLPGGTVPSYVLGVGARRCTSRSYNYSVFFVLIFVSFISYNNLTYSCFVEGKRIYLCSVARIGVQLH